MPDPYVPRVEPAALEGPLCGLRVVVVALSHIVPTHHNLAHRAGIPRHIMHSRINDAVSFGNHIPLTLAREQARLLLLGQLGPFFVPLADCVGAVCLCQAIDVDWSQIKLLHLTQQGWRWGCSGHCDRYLVLQTMSFRMVDEENMHGWCTVVVCHALAFKEIPDLPRIELTQADMTRAHRSHRPGEAPAITMKHGQRPKIHALTPESALDDLAQRVEIATTIGIHHPFRVARST